jgi:hypothetical protein
MVHLERILERNKPNTPPLSWWLIFLLLALVSIGNY